MEIQLIRNATMRISLAGKIILTDPVLLPRHGIESFAGIEKNPTVDLPMPVEKVIQGIDLVLVSHLHQDHFDEAAKKLLPKNIPLLCKPDDHHKIMELGFNDIRTVDERIGLDGLEITRTTGSHAGNDKWQSILGSVCGFLITAPDEPLIYWTGDTILTEDVKKTIVSEKPDIILTHSCGAVLDDSGPIVMDAQQTIDVCTLAPWATVVAVHLEALDHGTVTRKDVRNLARQNYIPESRLIIPDDGETLSF